MGSIIERLADPNLALLLLSLGLLGTLVELAGLTVIDLIAGAAGLLLLVLGLAMLGALQARSLGVLLLVLSASLLVGELYAPTASGLLAACGALLWILAWPLVFAPGAGPHPAVLWMSVPTMGVGSALVGRVARRVRHIRRSAPALGREALVGRQATVRAAKGRMGRVRLDGALWTARSADGPLHWGQIVEVVEVDGLRLVVVDARRAQQAES